MKSDEDYFSRNMTYFNVFLRILRLGEKYAYFTVFYNGFERTEQLWMKRHEENKLKSVVTEDNLRFQASFFKTKSFSPSSVGSPKLI